MEMQTFMLKEVDAIAEDSGYLALVFILAPEGDEY